MFTLFSFLIYMALFFLAIAIGAMTENNTEEGPSLLIAIPFILMGIYFLASFIPSIAVTVRRLHDVGQSGWLLLLQIVPFGGLVLFIFSLLESKPETNKWGPNPKALPEELITDHLIERL